MILLSKHMVTLSFNTWSKTLAGAPEGDNNAESATDTFGAKRLTQRLTCSGDIYKGGAKVHRFAIYMELFEFVNVIHERLFCSWANNNIVNFALFINNKCTRYID